MANIGSFKKSGQEFQGEIVTLSLQTKGVRIVPETDRTNDNAPSHRVYVGRAEIGAAWSKRSSEGRDYLSVKLDDPSFNAPIYAVARKCPARRTGRGLGASAYSPFFLRLRDQIRVKPSPSSSSKRLAKIGALKLGSSSLSER